MRARSGDVLKHPGIYTLILTVLRRLFYLMLIGVGVLCRISNSVGYLYVSYSEFITSGGRGAHLPSG